MDGVRRIKRVCHVALDVPSIGSSAAHAEDVIGLRRTESVGGWTYYVAGLRHFALEALHGLLKGGPGRHGPGNNPAIYHHDPAGAIHEHLADIERIDDPDRRGRDWADVPNWNNIWGPSPSRRDTLLPVAALEQTA